jgi:hypothetical protein
VAPVYVDLTCEATREAPGGGGEVHTTKLPYID